MKYAVNDVVWCKAKGKAAIIKAVHSKHYDVRSYDGEEFAVTEAGVGK